MFNSFKKAILTLRIKKAAEPILVITDNSTKVYINLLSTMLRTLMPSVDLTVQTLHDNADKVADVIIAAAPLIEAFKAKKEEFKKTYETYTSTTEKSLEDDPSVKLIEKNIELVKAAFKIES